MPDAAARLAVVGAFAALTDAARRLLAEEVDWLRIAGGETLVEQGDVGDCAYFVIRGRLRVSTADADGVERVVGDLGPGEPVGELALLADVARTATVRAVRDTEVVHMLRATFENVLRRDASTVIPLMGAVARRLADAMAGKAPDVGRCSTVALIAVTPGVTRALDGLVDALADRAPTVRVRVTAERDGSSHPQLIAAIDAQEAIGGVTVLDVDFEGGQAVPRALRQADTVVVVADATRSVASGAVLDVLASLRAVGCTPRAEIVLVQPSHRSRPVGTAPLVRDYDAHHHIRVGVAADCARVARHLLGTSIGLVLGGGGARGMAHIGAYRAIVEAGIPIDRVGGSSIGGILSAQVAAGWDPDEMRTRNSAEFPRARISRSFTLPLMSLLSERPAALMLDRMFSTLDLEDLWIPCFVTTVDLTACTLAIKQTGPAARWTRATASPPGLWPPVVDSDGSLHVDGAILDNLPVVPMRALGASRVIAVSVSRQRELGVPAGHDAPTRTEFVRGLVERSRATGFPHLVQVLNRSALVTGLAGHAVARAQSDVYVEPPVDRYTLGEYDKTAEIAPLGYEPMRTALAGPAAGAASWA